MQISWWIILPLLAGVYAGVEGYFDQVRRRKGRDLIWSHLRKFFVQLVITGLTFLLASFTFLNLVLIILCYIAGYLLGLFKTDWALRKLFGTDARDREIKEARAEENQRISTSGHGQ